MVMILLSGGVCCVVSRVNESTVVDKLTMADSTIKSTEKLKSTKQRTEFREFGKTYY